jgi:hypothetical protein
MKEKQELRNEKQDIRDKRLLITGRERRNH